MPGLEESIRIRSMKYFSLNLGPMFKIRFSHSKIGQNPDFLKLGQRPLGWPQTTFVDWKCVWYASLWCLGGSWVDFCWFETTFFWPTKIPKAQPPFFHFRSGLVRRNLSGVWLRSKVAWMIKLGSFLLKCSPTSTYHSPFEFWTSINFWKKLEQFESTVFTL